MTAARTLARRGLYAGLIIGLLALTSYRTILPVFRDHLLAYLSIDDRQFALLFSIPQWVSMAPLLLTGWLIARWGAQRIFSVSLLLAAAGAAAIALAGPDWRVLAGALSLAFTAFLLMEMTGNTVLVQWYPEGRRRVLSLALAVRSGTEMAVPVMAEGLIVLAAAPAFTFGAVLHAPFGLLALAFLAGVILLRQVGAHTRGRWRWRDLLVAPQSVGLLLLAVLHGTSDGILYFWMARYLGSDAFAAQPIKPGFVLAAFSVAYLVSRWLLALLPEGWGRRALLVLPGLLGGSVVILGLLSRDYLLTAAGYVLGGFLWSAEYPAMLGRIAEQEGERYGTALSLVSLVMTGASATVLLISGNAVQAVGEQGMWIPMVAIAAGFPLVGLGGALWLKLHGEAGG